MYSLSNLENKQFLEIKQSAPEFQIKECSNAKTSVKKCDHKIKKCKPVLSKGFIPKYGIRHGDVASKKLLTISQEYLNGLNVRQFMGYVLSPWQLDQDSKPLAFK